LIIEEKVSELIAYQLSALHGIMFLSSSSIVLNWVLLDVVVSILIEAEFKLKLMRGLPSLSPQGISDGQWCVPYWGHIGNSHAIFAWLSKTYQALEWNINTVSVTHR
jgi:hypothetical protein